MELIIRFLGRFATQLLIALLLFAPALERRKNFWIKFVIGIVVYSVFPYALTGFGVYHVYGAPYLYIGWLNLNWAAVFAMGVLLMLFLFKISFTESLFYATSAYAMQHFARKVAEIFNKALGFSGIWSYLNIMWIGFVVFILFYFIFAKQIQGRENLGIKDSHIVAVSVITILIVYVLSVFVGRDGERTNYSGKIYAAVCSLLLLIIQFGLFDREKKARERYEIEKMLYEQQEIHRLSRENIDIINIKCHDLKKQISAIRKLENEEQRNLRLKEVEKSILIYDSVAKTGNDTVDLIVTEKCLQCESYGIKFSYIVQTESLEIFDKIDLYTLLGNALDNAIEESIKIREPEKRVISLKIGKTGQVIRIHLENYAESKTSFKDGLPMTTKQNKQYHGYGMKSIKYIVDKYKGHMKISTDQEMFSLDILIPTEKD